MDSILTPAETAFVAEVRAFLETHLSERLRRAARLTSGIFAEPALALEWQRILEERGWLLHNWPQANGGPEWSPVQSYLFARECARAGAPSLPVMGLRLLGPVLSAFGTDAQRHRYVPPMRSGEHFWAQGFSEPEAGSDLASLKTRAERQGDFYLVNGTKIWTTFAQHATHLFCLARTGEAGPGGISFLLIDMDQPGVSVRPILSASGDHEVNQVFLSDVQVPVEDRIGEEGEGWGIAKFLLERERGGSCFAPALLADLDRLWSVVSDRRDAEAPLLRDSLVRLSIEAEALEMTEFRLRRPLDENGVDAGAGLATKLVASEIRQALDSLALDVFGAAALQLPLERPFWGDGMPDPIDSAEAQVAAARYLNGRAWSIFGGTSEIQLNIIARHRLGLG